MEGILRTLPVVKKVHHSDTNFILFQVSQHLRTTPRPPGGSCGSSRLIRCLCVRVQVPNAYDIYREMAEEGVVARYRGKDLHCDDCIRLTIGKPHENDTFLDKFKAKAEKFLSKYTTA